MSMRPRALVLTPLALLSLWVMAACAPLAAGPQPRALIVSAASDLTPAFTEIGRRFTEETGIPVTFNFGASGQLAQQIAEGAPVDIFAAANAAYIDELAQSGLILADTQAVYARGHITLWQPAGSEVMIENIGELTLPHVERIAIANPDHAPYGVAAREALQSAGIWDEVQPKLIFGENIAQTLQLAETGNVDVAIMALSLSIPSDGQWTQIPEGLHMPLDQTLAVITDTENEAAAREFAAFVNGPEGRAIMRRYGFTLPGEEVSE